MENGDFIPGRELSRRLYELAVRPSMERHAPGIPFAAALIGPGSDVLGYDSARSMDHDWGPRLTIVLPDDADNLGTSLSDRLLQDLPPQVAGFPTRFREFEDDPGIAHMATDGKGGALFHRVKFTTLPRVLHDALGIRSISDMDVATWLTVPEQVLLELTAGDVFHDDGGDLTAFRASIAWYPDDVWRYRLAAAWMRMSQVEPFIGRAGEVDDDIGSQVIALSLVRDIMRLALLQGRRYAPYAKWLGTAFADLEVADMLKPHLDVARFAPEWAAREQGIVAALAMLANRQNALGLAEHVDPSPRRFFSRPFPVLGADRFAHALQSAIHDPVVKALPPYLGGIDQFVDSTDALVNRDLRVALRQWLRDRPGHTESG